MTKAKKLVAAMLAFLMIFSSVSAISYAADETGIAGNALSIGTKFFKEVDGEWVETEKVRPGDVVEARVYLGTDYYSATSTLLFFYDKDFFTTAYGTGDNSLEVNANSSFVTANDVYGHFSANAGVTASEAGVSDEFLASNGYFLVQLQLPGAQNVKFDASDWLFKFTLTVAEGATGSGDLFVEESSIQTTDNSSAIINVPKGEANSNPDDNWPMWLWDANVTLTSQPVSTISSVTFNANGGEFAADDTAKFCVEGEIDSAITATMPTLTRAGYTFKGWIDAADTTPTEEEVIAAPTQIPEEDLELNAYWVKNVNITFNTDGGTEIPAITDVTPGDAFATVADPTKPGYTFRGWDVAEGTLPAEYPTVDTVYTAIWALNVTVSFDTKGGTDIAPVGGYEGQAFEAEIPNPEKPGYYFIGWAPAGTYDIVSLPDVFPGEDVTYDAVYETDIYTAEFYVDGVLKSALRVPYGATVNVPFIPVEEGVVLDGWYTDVDCTVPYTPTAMGGNGMKLYAKTVVEEYTVIFMNGDEEVARDEYAIGEVIVAPAAPEKAGYTFIGWTPDVGIMDATETKYFYATWEANAYTVTYNYNYEGAGVYVAFDDIEFGAEVEIADEPTREGYTFKGWGATAEATAEAEIPATMPADNLVYYAIWEVNEYTITFNTDGGTPVDPIKEAYGTALTAPTAPTKTGYDFIGWAPEFPATMPAEDLTLVAQWEIKQFKISFETLGGTVIPDITGDFGDGVTAPANPEKEGHVFAGWDKEIPATIPAENVTITAKWTPETYTIAFDSNGGSKVDPIPATFGETVSVPTAPTKEGAVFAGWVENIWDENGKYVVEDLGDNEATITLVAQWTTETYTVAFDEDGGSDVADLPATYNEAITLPAGPVKEGYTFKNWVDGEGNTYNAGASYTVGDLGEDKATVTLFTAQYEIETYTITVVNGVTGETIATITKAYDEAIDAVTAPDVTGYTFAGFSEEIPSAMPDLGENGATKTITANYTILQFTISFDSDGGSDVKDITQDYNTAVTAPADPTKEGHKFTGWTPSVPATMPAENITLTATWEALPYISLFVLDGGNINGATDDVTVTTVYNNTIVAPGTPVKQGYVFSGWSLDGGEPSTTVSTVQPANNNLVFTAVWANAEDTPYKIETWEMNTEGEYVLVGTADKTGETNTLATATPETKTGFTFNEAESLISDTIRADGNTVLVLKYARNKYEFTYTVDGVTSEPVKYYYEETVPALSDPSKVGYEFKGWEPAVPATMPAENINVVAKFEEASGIEFKVVINYTNVQNNTAATIEKKFYGTTGQKIEIVEATGADADVKYIVIGTDLALNHYHLDTTAANQLNGEIKADGSTILNVYYVANEYHVIFYKDADKAEVVAEGDYTYFTNINTIVPAAPEKEGYVFAAWSPAAAGRLEADAEFVATWTQESYTFKVVDDVTGAVIVSKPYAYGAAIDEVIAPELEGYDFVEFVGGIPATMPDAGANGATYEVVAHYEKEVYNFKVVDDVTGAVIVDTTYEYGVAIDEVIAPELKGYDFVEFVGGIPATMPDAGEAGDTYEVTAHYAKEVFGFKVTDNVTGAVIVETTYAYGDAIDAVEAPELKGYDFVKFDKEIPATMDDLGEAGDVLEIVAEYTKETFGFKVVDNVTGAVIVETTYAYGDAIDAVEAPELKGYDFVKFDKEIPATMDDLGEAGDVLEIVAEYTKETFVLKVVDNVTGAVIHNATYAYGDTIPAITAPELEGYTFVNFSDEIPGIMDDLGEAGDVLEITANYTKDGFGLKVVDNVTGAVIHNEIYEYGATIPEIKAPEVEGYKFVKFDKEIPGTMGDLGAAGTVLEVVAEYAKESYKFKVVDDVTGAVIVETTYEYDAAINEVIAPELKGYDFVEFVGGIPATMPDAGADGATYEVVAHYEKKVFGFKVVDNITGAVIVDTTYAYGDAIDTVTAPEVEGYEFVDFSEEIPATMDDLGEAGDVLEITANYAKESFGFKVVDNITGAVIVETTYEFGAAIGTVEAPEREGYIFDKFDKEIPATMGDLGDNGAVLEVTALYNKETYTLAFDSNGGAAVESMPVTFGDTVKLPAAPAYTGYIFEGWNDGETTYAAGADYAVADLGANNATVTFTAQWKAAPYSVRYMGVSGLHEEIAVDFGTPKAEWATPATAPERTGYEFAGWDFDAVAFDAMPAETVAVNANWTIESFGLKVVDNVTGAVIHEDTYTFGAAIPVIEAPEVEGYEFADFSEEIPATMGDLGVAGTVLEVTANYNKESYTFKVVDDITGAVIVETTYEYDAAIDAVNAPEREGHDFVEFVGGIPATMPDAGANGATYEVVAHYEKEVYNFKVVDDVKGAVIVETTYAYGDKIATVTAPEVEGYEFVEFVGGIPATMPDAGEAGDTYTVTAHYAVQQFTITFTNTGDSVVPEITLDYGTAIEKPADPSKYGYNFKAWSEEIPATMPAKDMTIAATWDAKVIGVQFNANGGEFAEGQETATFDNIFDKEITYTAPTRSGYGFSGWSTDPNATEGEMDLGLLVTEEPATYYAVWNAGATEYAIEIYEMDLSGEYQLIDTKTGSGETDSTATYTAPDKNGFTPVEKVVSGTITADPKLVLVVKYERNKIALNYSVLGNVVKTFDVYYGTPAADMPVADAPEVEGYTFAGWSGAPATMPAVETTINAEMNLESYTILLVNGVDGSTIATIKQNYGTAINPVADPEYTGYEFKGWSETIPETMPDLGANGAEKTITANFEKESYTIAFNSDGGSAVDPIPATYGETISKPADPTKAGYTFTGWVDNIWNAEGKYVVEDLGENGATKTLTATWAIESYTIAFDTDGGSAVNPIPATYGETISKPADPTKDGHTFTGWEENIWDAEGKYVVADLGDNEATKTLVAQWAKETYTLKVVDNITGAVIHEKAYEYGADIDEIKAPDVAGYDFVEWSEEIPATMPDAGNNGDTKVITAVYSVNAYTITFDTKGGSAVDEISGNYGDPVVAPADPTKTGYEFKGWAAAADSTEKVELPATIPAGDVTYYAIWEAIDYTITWNYNGKVATSTYNYEDPITAFEVPADAMPGYYFATWDKKVPATMPAEDLEFNAIFEVKTYKVAYMVNGVKVGEYSLAYGAVIPDSVVSYTVPEGETFDGWYTDEAMSVKFVAGTTVTDDAVLYAKTTVNEHTATFKLEGGNVNGSTEDIVKTYKYDEVIVAPVPVKEGYVFAGWSPEVGLMEDEDMTFVAVWVAADGLSITYVDELNGTSLVFDDMSFGLELEIPDDPTKEGYTFIGWFTEDGKTPEEIATMPATSLVFKAEYEINKYTVTFNDAEGNELTSMPDVEYGYELTAEDLEIAAEEVPEIEGKTFKYWTVNGQKVEAGYKVTGETVLVPYYAGNLHTVTFTDADGNELSAMADIAYGYELTEEDFEIAAEDLPEVEGKHFAYWTVDGQKVAAGYAVTGDVTITAYYEVNLYTVTFTDADGNELTSMPDIAHGYELIADDFDMAAEDLPEVEGKEFAYWTVNGEKVEAGYKVTGDVTIVAYYEEVASTTVTVTYMQYEESEHGPYEEGILGYTDYTTQTYNAGETLTVAANPATAGTEHYDFNGWVDADGNVYADGAAITGDITLYPTYTRHVIKLLPREGSKIVVERNGVKESYLDNSVTYNEYTAANYEQYYVYGFTAGRSMDTVNNIKTKSITYYGDARIDVAPLAGQSRLGTGATIKVYDAATDELVESFYIVVFGDINGNGNIDTNDIILLDKEANGGTREWSNTRVPARRVYYKMKAANIDGATNILNSDVIALKNVYGTTFTLDQTTGKATEK